MAAPLTNQPITVLGTPDINTFVLGGFYEFTYRGERRSGKVDKVTTTTVILFCDTRQAYRQFRYELINK